MCNECRGEKAWLEEETIVQVKRPQRANSISLCSGEGREDVLQGQISSWRKPQQWTWPALLQIAVARAYFGPEMW